MKLRLALLSLLVLCWATFPAIAQTDTDLYDNGATNGSVDAWTINFGFVVSNSFTMSSRQAVNDVQFAAWLFPGDILQSAEVSITSFEFGGTTFWDGTVNFTQFGCATNQLGFSVCDEIGALGGGVSLNSGTYWLNLQNAVVNTGDPVYWDENSGPSSASENSVGTIPSESFTILGGESATSTSTSTGTGTTPEPASVMLFGSGIIGALGFARRNLVP